MLPLILPKITVELAAEKNYTDFVIFIGIFKYTRDMP